MSGGHTTPVGGANPPEGRTGRPPLTERRKAATRLEIAREAVRLFTAKGVAETSAEEIAAAAGLSVRTLWRYFPTKESCVWPLLTAGIDNMARALRTWRPGQDISEVLDEMARTGDDIVQDMPTLLVLVRMTRTEPGLRAVWLQAHDDAEPVFADVFAERAGVPGDDLDTRVRAAMINGALRAAFEHYAWRVADAGSVDEDGLAETMRAALRAATRGVSH
ncbi:TetR/AcrR family transcriptional regulator [Saccharothrix deserti]|uniref:TetR/AcrR family transcriptional regulator n=1 Tax=Saccharothrix deserti TaxID=2593674 RepID=UPI00131D98E4|nr:TetR/AcrR family transcriptional regulator [Saccharothrix deserti]